MVNYALLKTKIIEERSWRVCLCKRSNVGLFFIALIILFICYTLITSETSITHLQIETSLTNDDKNLSYTPSTYRSITSETSTAHLQIETSLTTDDKNLSYTPSKYRSITSETSTAHLQIETSLTTDDKNLSYTPSKYRSITSETSTAHLQIETSLTTDDKNLSYTPSKYRSITSETSTAHLQIETSLTTDDKNLSYTPSKYRSITSETSTAHLQIETSLTTDDKNLSYAPSKYRSCPKNGIVTGSTNGRLGNHLWEYASVWLRAKKTGLEPFVTNSTIETLSALLDNLDIPIIENIAHCSVKNGIQFENMSIPNNSIVLGVYEESPDLLAENINDINKIFTIKKSFLDKGQEILKASVKRLNSSVETYVGVHVRRTDYFDHLKILYNIDPTNVPTFIKSAMAYYERKYPNPIFIFVSDDPDWCFDTFGCKRNVYVSAKYHESSPELDMAVMASCNHSIIDYGTYGQWGALFAGGETVFYKIDKGLSSEKLSKHLKYWHPLKRSDIIHSFKKETSFNNSDLISAEPFS